MQKSSVVIAIVLGAFVGACSDSSSKTYDLSLPTDDLSSVNDLSTSPDMTTLAAYGGACTAGTQCTSGYCILPVGGGTMGTCTVACSLSSASSCAMYKAFCEPNTPSPVCAGSHVDTGADGDDAIIMVGDTLTKNVGTLTDADLFQLTAPVGKYSVVAAPMAGIDLAIDAFDSLGEAIGTSNNGGAGVGEAFALSDNDATAPTYFIVRNVGSGTGSYTFSVAVSP